MFSQYLTLKNKPTIAVTILVLFSLPTQMHFNKYILYSLVALKGSSIKHNSNVTCPRRHCTAQWGHPPSMCCYLCKARKLSLWSGLMGSTFFQLCFYNQKNQKQFGLCGLQHIVLCVVQCISWLWCLLRIISIYDLLYFSRKNSIIATVLPC